jgi:hypothetical protein
VAQHEPQESRDAKDVAAFSISSVTNVESSVTNVESSVTNVESRRRPQGG